MEVVMRTCRALFIPLSSIQSESGLLNPTVMDMLRDYAAMGYRIIAVTDRLEYCNQSYSACSDLLAALRSDRSQRYAAPFSDVILMKNPFDPGPFWDTARRFNLALGSSTFVTHKGVFLAGARNAGVGLSEPFQSIFGMAA